MTKMTKSVGLSAECLDPTAFSKIVEALQTGNIADAAIRLAQWRSNDFPAMDALERVFDPSEPRDDKGRWTGGSAVHERRFANTSSVGWCKIVKQLCIVEATDTLQTSDYGFQFWNAMNACMARHGYLGVA